MTDLNYTHQNLQDRSFKGQDLAGADFSGSDLRGCDFTAANLTGANFEGSETGQSRRQINRLLIAAVVGPVLLIGVGFGVAKLIEDVSSHLPASVLKVLTGALPFMVLIGELFLRDLLVSCFPQTTAYLGVAAIAMLFAVMVGLTLGLGAVSLSNFSDGAVIPALFLLLLMGVAAALSVRILKWVKHGISSSPGTCFKKANLTDANLSRCDIQNTDFSLAVLTGACIADWLIMPHTQFDRVYCEYLYLQPDRQNRQPAAGKFKAGELAQVLTQFSRR